MNINQLIKLATLFASVHSGFACSEAVHQTAEFEVVFKDHAWNDLPPVGVRLAVDGSAGMTAVENPELQAADTLRIQVSGPSTTLHLEAYETTTRALGMTRYENGAGSHVELPSKPTNVQGVGFCEMPVGATCTVTAADNTLAVVRRVR